MAKKDEKTTKPRRTTFEFPFDGDELFCSEDASSELMCGLEEICGICFSDFGIDISNEDANKIRNDVMSGKPGTIVLQFEVSY